MRLNASTHPERRRRGRSLATIVAVAALAAALQATPAGAMISDEGIGVCERVPGIEGGWNFTTGQPCTLGEDAGGQDDAIEVEATRDPNAIIGEPIYVREPKAREAEPKLKQLCRNLDCTRKSPGRSAADRDLFGSPDGPKRGSGRKEKGEEKRAETEAKRQKCLQLGMDGFVWHTPRGRLGEANSITDEIRGLDRRIEALRVLERISAIGDDRRKELQAQRDKLQKEFDNIEPSRDKFRDGGCAQTLREPVSGEYDKGPGRR